MRIHPFPEETRAIGHRPHHPLNRRWGILPDRTHLRRGYRMRGHILRIRHHRGQGTG